MKFNTNRAKATLRGFFLMSILMSLSAKAQTDPVSTDTSQIKLNEVLNQILSSTSGRKDENLPKYKSSQWLAASPTANLNYLKSQETLGTDEIEVGINFAIKSSKQRQIDQKLAVINNKILQQQQTNLKLYYSGLLREIFWSFKIANKQQEHLANKLRLLKKLEEHQRDLSDAGESSIYGLLVVSKEIIATKIELLDNRAKLLYWQKHYSSLTGLTEIPRQIDEPIFNKNQWQASQHPEVILIQLLRQQAALEVKENASDTAPWTLSVSAKEVDSQGVTDKQLGLSFDVPFTFIEANKQSLANQQLQQGFQYDKEYQSKLIEIDSQITQLKVDRDYLQSKVALLQDSVEISASIMKQMDRLKSHNELGQEMALRRLLEAMKTRYEYQVTQVLVEQNNSLSLQAAGISL